MLNVNVANVVTSLNQRLEITLAAFIVVKSTLTRSNKLNKENFKAGDVVILKSGGPFMTVTGVSYDGTQVQCLYFDSKEQLNEEVFHKDILLIRKS